MASYAEEVHLWNVPESSLSLTRKSLQDPPLASRVIRSIHQQFTLTKLGYRSVTETTDASSQASG